MSVKSVKTNSMIIVNERYFDIIISFLILFEKRDKFCDNLLNRIFWNTEQQLPCQS